MLLRSANINTNPETAESETLSQTGSFFPKTSEKSNGQGFTNQNRKVGQFTGVISNLRPIHSKTNPTVFAVIDITVQGEQGVFQDYLNFNSTKATQTMSYLVNHTKSLITSAGYETDPEEEKDMEWVEESIKELVKNKATVTFAQSLNSKGLTINYL